MSLSLEGRPLAPPAPIADFSPLVGFPRANVSQGRFSVHAESTLLTPCKLGQKRQLKHNGPRDPTILDESSANKKLRNLGR
jgi:hypothetical protein